LLRLLRRGRKALEGRGDAADGWEEWAREVRHGSWGTFGALRLFTMATEKNGRGGHFRFRILGVSVLETKKNGSGLEIWG
jgi:hypothetical protein